MRPFNCFYKALWGIYNASINCFKCFMMPLKGLMRPLNCFYNAFKKPYEAFQIIKLFKYFMRFLKGFMRPSNWFYNAFSYISTQITWICNKFVQALKRGAQKKETPVRFSHARSKSWTTRRRSATPCRSTPPARIWSRSPPLLQGAARI